MMENITNTYTNNKVQQSVKTKQNPVHSQFQYHSAASESNENTVKQQSSRYSSQIAYDNTKHIANSSASIIPTMNNAKSLSKEVIINQNINVMKSQQLKHDDLYNDMKGGLRGADAENQNPLPHALYSHINNNMKIQTELKKQQVLKQQNKGYNGVILSSKNTVSQSPKPVTHQHIDKVNSYEHILNNQKAVLDIFGQLDTNNNRNSQPPLQSNSHNPCVDKKIKQQILGEKKKSIPGQNQKHKSGVSSHDQSNIHKKSQSLFNKKIVDIIAGLQQSLGVITNNVKNSFNTEEFNQLLMNNIGQTSNGVQNNTQKKTLLESALLAQRLAQMTSILSGGVDNKKYRKSSGGKQQKVVSYNASICPTQGYQTIEDPVERNMSVSNRASIEGRQSLNKKANIHSRTKSDLQHCRKQGSSQVKTVDVPYQQYQQLMNSDNNQGQGSQLTKSIQGQLNMQQLTGSGNHIIGYYHPISTKHKKTNYDKSGNSSSNNDSNNRFKKKSNNNSKNNGTLTNQRGSISSNKQTNKLSCERLSDAHFIANINKKNNNLFINNLSNDHNQIQSRLKSAASSPSLHTANQQNKQTLNLKKKDKNTGVQQKQIFDFGNQSKVNTKKKDINQSSHKRSISDGTSLTKMFHFKQQMMLNKLLCKDNSAQVSSSNSIQDAPSGFNHQFQNKNKMSQLGSNLSSKRLSKENGLDSLMLSEHNYNSPRQQQIIQNSRLSNSNQRDIYSEMKNFLQKFQQKTLSQASGQTIANGSQIIPKSQQLQMLAAFNNVDTLTAGVSGITRSTTNTTISNGSVGVMNGKPNKKQTVRVSNKFTNPVSILAQSVSSQQTSKQQLNHHKRAKSDINFQFDVIRGSGSGQTTQQVDTQKSKIVSNYAPQKQNMFVLNMKQQPDTNLQILSQTPMIYSARASPTSKQIYNNFDEILDARKQSQQLLLATNRSDKCSTSKFNAQNQLVFTSNQTTQRKQPTLTRDCSSSEHKYETPQFNYAQLEHGQQQQQLVPPPKINNLCYYDMVMQQEIKNNKTNDNNKNRNLMIKSTNFSKGMREDSNDSSYQQMEMMSSNTAGLDKKNMHINSSPQLKVLPTPKAVQPGINGGIPSQSLLILHTNQTHQSLSSLDNVKQRLSSSGGHFNNYQSKDSQQIVAQQSKDNGRIETIESNANKYDNMSPRGKEKQRIIKLIKVSFNKFKEAPKTSEEFYRIGKMLGKGAFGRVNLAIHKLTDYLVAVKSINKQFLSEDESSKKKVMQELLILQKTRQQNIVKLYDSFESNKHIVFVMELCGGGDLLNYVRKRRKLKEEVAQYVFRQVVDGLEYCHAKGIVHRDIKLDNLLLDSNGTVKICDFGVSKLLQDRKKDIMTEQCGTPAYIAPEILKDKGYKGFGVDIWSLGVCLYAMLYGTVPFKANNMSELHQLIIKAKYTLKDDKIEISDTAKSLIRALLEPDPLKRLNISQVKQHPWLIEAYQLSDEIEIFSEAEKQGIKKDFTYQDMKRYQRNQGVTNKAQIEDNGEQQAVLTTEHFFTEHALDSTQNALLRNCTTKSLVLAPFNSTRSHLPRSENQNASSESIFPPLDIDENMMLDKKVIRFAARVKDIDRQYEMNNNCELDNGVYNKFVKQSTQKGDKEGISPEQDNSLRYSGFKQRGEGPQAPLVSQNSDEDVEVELIKRNQVMQGLSELEQIQSFLQTHQSIPQIEEQQFIIDFDTVEKVEELGYPREFIVNSLEQYEMNDATTSYFLLEKVKLIHGYSVMGGSCSKYDM